MIGIRIENEEFWLEEREWVLWVEDGRIPPHALIRAEEGWVPAGRIAAYRELRERGRQRNRAPKPLGVFSTVFPKRGLSATEFVILANLVVAGVLTALWGATYSSQLRELAGDWWQAVRYKHAYYYWFPPSFLHADLKHLSANMVSLLVGAGAIEVVAGARWVLVTYLVTALGCSALSFWGHGGPPLSVGASGAVFGFGGAAISFTARRYRSFTFRQRWKARRIYVALFVLFTLPSLVNADYWGHMGGFLAGLALGGFLPAHPRLRDWLDQPDPD